MGAKGLTQSQRDCCVVEGEGENMSRYAIVLSQCRTIMATPLTDLALEDWRQWLTAAVERSSKDLHPLTALAEVTHHTSVDRTQYAREMFYLLAVLKNVP
jgi:hypothetical protein